MHTSRNDTTPCKFPNEKIFSSFFCLAPGLKPIVAQKIETTVFEHLTVIWKNYGNNRTLFQPKVIISETDVIFYSDNRKSFTLELIC